MFYQMFYQMLAPNPSFSPTITSWQDIYYPLAGLPAWKHGKTYAVSCRMAAKGRPVSAIPRDPLAGKK
jgi:hypothetical protein